MPHGSIWFAGFTRIYAPNTVVHMLSGKAISRALRGHFLVDAALNGLIIADIFNVAIPQCSEITDEETRDHTNITVPK